MADPLTALDGPHPVFDRWPEPVDVIDHRGEPGLIGAEPATPDDGLVSGHHLDRDRPLVWVHPDHDPICLLLHAPSRSSIQHSVSSREGNATSSWADPS